MYSKETIKGYLKAQGSVTWGRGFTIVGEDHLEEAVHWFWKELHALRAYNEINSNDIVNPQKRIILKTPTGGLAVSTTFGDLHFEDNTSTFRTRYHLMFKPADTAFETKADVETWFLMHNELEVIKILT